MDLDRKQWYVRWFFFSLSLLDTFLGEPLWRKEKYDQNANLCTFMVVSFALPPVIFALNAFAYACLALAAIVAPIRLFGIVGVAKAMGECALAGSLLFGAFMLLDVLSQSRTRWRRKRVERDWAMRTMESEAHRLAAAAVRGPSFASVLHEYGRSIKGRLCLSVSFK